MNVAPGAWRYAIGPIVAAPFALVVNVPVGVGLAVLGVAVLGFFRDPDRSPPAAGFVAPADGKVSVLRAEGENVRLGIFMNVWNVHVIRAPADGEIHNVEHTPGAHRPAFSKDSDRNERVHVDFTGRNPTGTRDSGPEHGGDDDVDPAPPPIEEVTLVAGAFARRITPYVEPETTVERGDRIGHIAFGSRVDVVFSPEVAIEDLAVEPGDATRAGETIVLESTGSAGRPAHAGADPEPVVEGATDES